MLMLHYLCKKIYNQIRTIMNRKFTAVMTLLLTILAFGLSGCSDSENENGKDYKIWDIVPLTIKVDVQDDNGVSLLQPDASGCIVGENMEVEYHGEVYPVIWNYNEQQPGSRAVLAVFEGLIYGEDSAWNPDKGHWEKTGEYRLFLGTLPRDASYERTLLLRYNGQEHTIVVNNSFKWKNNEPDIETLITCDGQEADGARIVIRK